MMVGIYDRYLQGEAATRQGVVAGSVGRGTKFPSKDGVYPMVPAGHALDEMILDMA